MVYKRLRNYFASATFAIFYTTVDGKCNPKTSIVLNLYILIWIKMVNFKPVALFLKIISLFIVQRNFGNIIYDYVQKYNTLKIEQLRKYEKLKIKIRKAELDVTFLKNCQTLNVTPKFLTINLQILVYTIYSSSRKDYYEVQLIKETKGWDYFREIYQIMNEKLEEYCHPLISLPWAML